MPRRLLAVNPTVIDLLVLYTTQAKIDEGGDAAIQAKIQEQVDDSLATKMVFKKNGTVSFSWKTENLGVPPDMDGTWEVLQEGHDATIVRLTVGGASFEARLAFGDKDSFTFTCTDRKQTPLQFTRNRD